MCRHEWPDRFRSGRPNGRGFERRPVVKPTILLPLFAAYALGFVILYPFVQASVSRSAAEGNDPMAFVSQ